MSGSFASLSLQQKVSMTLLAVVATLLLVSYLVLSTTVASAFADLEQSNAERNFVRAQRAIQSELANLGTIAGDWSPWDDAHAFARGENPGFPKSNLDVPTMINLGLDLLLIYDTEGKVLWRHALQNGEAADHRELELFHSDEPRSARLITHPHIESRKEGLVQTGLGPMLLTSRPIITSEKTGPIAGTIIMGQFFDDATRAILRERTEVSLSWHLLDEESPMDDPLTEEVVAAGPGTFTHSITNREIRTFGLLTDMFGEPLMILQVDTPRRISALGRNTVNAALLFLSVAGIVIAIVTWMLLRRTIVLPLERLARHISGIRESGDLSLRLDEKRSDEIGALAVEFDQMTQEVHEARGQLLDQSFKAGKADTAAEVLHNIRNAMTPLINGIDRLSRSFTVVGGLHVQQATEELASAECPAERRSKLLQYIASAFSHIRKVGEEAVRDLEVASRQARQVEAILGDQEKYANVAPVIESLELRSVMEEASLIMPKSDRVVLELNVQQDIEKFRVLAHRVGLLQVMGNLVLNAYESIQRSQAGSGRIDVSAEFTEVDGTSWVRLSVLDSGSGFDDEQHQKIFQRGFSSKEGHMSGLGLHWCANALAVMGGRISGESKGRGRGAAFHVLLPAAAHKPAKAAHATLNVAGTSGVNAAASQPTAIRD